MVSPEHQKLVNRLALGLENRGIQIRAIAMAGTPQYFNRKYRRLSKPRKYGGSIPDLVGVDVSNRIHLGEAETIVYGKNTSVQLANFSKWAKSNAGTLHVIVPPNMKTQMMYTIQNSRLGANIRIWS